MSRSIFALLIALGCLLGVPTASAHTQEQVRMIEQAYARLHDGELIPDNQLEYYLDRSDAGWSMAQISADMELADRTYHDIDDWHPQPGWVAREVVCSSIGGQYEECPAPFRGTAVMTLQLSQAPCIEGQSWGQRPGIIWVNRGCRARFGIVRTTPPPVARTVVCQSFRGRYRECATGFRGRVRLVERLPNSGACIEGRSWGQREGIVWVRRGCRARFERVSRREGGGWMSNFYVTCSSMNGLPARCAWDERYGRPRLDQTLSSVPCIEGRTWGYDNYNHIWVTAGCRGRFVSSQTSFSYIDRDAPWVRDNNYSVTCFSYGGGRSTCTWDARYGNPYLIETMSPTACLEGRDWGYDSRGGLWVSGNCRARFGYRP